MAGQRETAECENNLYLAANKQLRAVSSAVERLVYTELVGGSNPSSPTRPQILLHHPIFLPGTRLYDENSVYSFSAARPCFGRARTSTPRAATMKAAAARPSIARRPTVAGLVAGRLWLRESSRRPLPRTLLLFRRRIPYLLPVLIGYGFGYPGYYDGYYGGRRMAVPVATDRTIGVGGAGGGYGAYEGRIANNGGRNGSSSTPAR